MTEYWVSREKHYCKYCNLYIADDKPSRTQHETGFRHKGAVERFIKGIYREGAAVQKSAVEEAREMARIDDAANAAMGIPTAGSSSAPRFKATAKAKSSDPFANYSTAESLGFASTVAPVEPERVEGAIGQWERVVRAPRASTSQVPAEDELEKATLEQERAEAKEARLAERVDHRKFLAEKTRVLDDDELYDPSKTIKLKRQRVSLADIARADKLKQEEDAVKLESRQRGAGWAEIAVVPEGLQSFEELVYDSKPVVKEESQEDIKTEDVKEELVEAVVPEEKPVVGGGFKKRKMMGASANRKK